MKTDVSDERISSIIRLRRISELGTLAVTNNVCALRRNTLLGVLRLLVTANAVPSSLILYTLIMEAILSFESSVLTGATLRNIQEYGILHMPL
jgi:hypothetical protein